MRALLSAYGGPLLKAVGVHTAYVLVSVALVLHWGWGWALSSPACPGGCPIW